MSPHNPKTNKNSTNHEVKPKETPVVKKDLVLVLLCLLERVADSVDDLEDKNYLYATFYDMFTGILELFSDSEATVKYFVDDFESINNYEGLPKYVHDFMVDFNSYKKISYMDKYIKMFEEKYILSDDQHDL